MLCDCLTLGGKTLLDVGPKEDGTLDERQVKVLEDLGSFIHDNEEAIYLFVYDKPLENLCVKGVKTPVKRVSVLHTGEELEFSYTGSLPRSGIPGTLWIRADRMQLHPLTTVLKVELADEITYNLGHGEVVTKND